jgi:hypothetical protein
MRRLVAWIGGAVGGLTAYRLLRRRRIAGEDVSAEPEARAEELRAKLAESRGDVAAEPAVDPAAREDPDGQPESPEDRRRRVHDEGRAALDEMKSD